MALLTLASPCWLHMPPPPLLPLSCRPPGCPPHPYLAPEFPLSSAIYKLHHVSCSSLVPYRAILFLLCPVSCGVLRWVPSAQSLRREFLGKGFSLLLWALRAITGVTPCPYEKENSGIAAYVDKIDTWGWQSFQREGDWVSCTMMTNQPWKWDELLSHLSHWV